jgi:hypothetical protein
MKFLIRNNDFWKVILPTVLKEEKGQKVSLGLDNIKKDG